jgi:ribosome recycling factor
MIAEVLSELSQSAEKAHTALKRDLAKLRTGRAHPAMLDGIRVDYYGQLTPLSQMATVAVPEPRLITVKPWDKSQVKAVEKALKESGLGLNPAVDGDLIRIPVPPLSEERRRELVKVAKKHGEECKVAIRKARHEALDMLIEIQRDGAASEDDVQRARKKAEDIVAEAGNAVDIIIHGRERDILEI